MQYKRPADPNKGYPKRLLRKYGQPAPAQRTTTVANETTMDSKTSPSSDAPPLPAPAATTPSTSAPTTPQDVPANATHGTQPSEEPGKPEKPEKRADPQTAAEFIEAFYAGRAKVLSEATVRRLKNSPIALEAAVRGDLLRRALAADESLDKTRRLLVLSTEVDELKALGHLLLQFAADVVVLHPAVRTNGMQAHLFPPYGEERSLEDAWHLLKASDTRVPPSTVSTEEQPVASTVDEATSGASGAESGTLDSPNRSAKVAAAMRAAQQSANKARRNALLCSVVWRVLHRKQLPFAEAMRALRGTLFAQGVEERRLESELLEALALMPEKEDAKVALLLQWTTKQQSDLVNKFTAGQTRIESLTERISDLEAEVEEGTQQAQSLRQELEFERASKEELGRHIGVVKTHGEADYEELRAASLRSIRSAVQQFEQVSIALGRDVPKVAFAREVLDTIVDSLRVTTKKLEEL